MRICLVSQDYPPETGSGGIGTHTAAKARGLAALGHEVHVLSHSPDDHRYELPGAVRLIRIPGPDHRLEVRSEPVRWLAWSQEVAAALDDLHADRDFDVIDFPEYGAEAFTYLLNRTDPSPKVTVHLQGPLVMLAHELGWPELDSELYRLGTMMEATCLRLADAVYSSSALSARWVADRYGLDAAAIPVLHAGVDTRAFRPNQEAASDDRPTIVFVGKVGPSKGADVLVEAACRVADREPELRVQLYGREVGRTGEQLLARAAAAGHPDLVELAGFVGRDDLPAALGQATIFAAPSPYEGGPGFVYLEAMACGLPVIGCSGSGIAETIVEGVNGHLVPPGDVGALAACLSALLDDPAGAAQLGARARQWAVDNVDSARLVPKIAAFLDSVLRSA